MRLPTRNELQNCLCPQEKGTAKNYWSGTFTSASVYYVVFFTSCGGNNYNKTNSFYVKCVK
jgi:hypothetical protein